MKIFLICSKKFYDRVEEAKKELEKAGNEVFLPNCYDDPGTEARMKLLGEKEHQEFKAKMYKQSEDTIKDCDAVVVLNFDTVKNGIERKNYIGGATFLEMYDAHKLGKEIYLYNDIPECDFTDEIKGMSPVIVNGHLEYIRESFGLSYAKYLKEGKKPESPTCVEYPEAYQFMNKKDVQRLTLNRKEDTK